MIKFLMTMLLATASLPGSCRPADFRDGAGMGRAGA